MIAGQSAFADGPVVSVRSPGSADAAAPRPAATRVGSRVDLTGARQALAAPVATYAPGAIDLALSTVVGGLSSPLFVTNAGDGSGRLFVVEKAGKIKIVSGGVVTGTFLDIRAKVSKDGERGLLGLAFHPDYPTTGTFYVYYTDLKGKIALAVYHGRPAIPTRPTRSAASCSGSASRSRTTTAACSRSGPTATCTWASATAAGGDPGNRAQNLKSLLGKMLRIDINGRTAARPYRIPSSNPYVGKVGYDQIWALRPPQPVAVLVRSPDRRPVDRRCRPGPLGGDRPVPGGRRRRSGQELRLAGHGGQGLLQPVVPLHQVRQEAAAGRLQSRQGAAR